MEDQKATKIGAMIPTIFGPYPAEPAKADPHGSRKFALQPANSRRRFRGRRKRIRKDGVAPKLNDTGKANVRFRLARAKRREKAAA